MYISGALVQYDQTPSTHPFGTRLSVNLDPLDTSAETETITVGIVLRAISSSDGLILDNGKKINNTTIDKTTAERASVYVQNTYFVKKIGFNLFEIKSRRLYGGNFTVEVSDPTNYVIKEMAEAGIYSLLKKTIRPDEKQHGDCDSLIVQANI